MSNENSKGVYVIAQISIIEPDAYNRYQAAFMEVFERFNGQVLAADADPQVVEGIWDKEKVILLYFPDRNSFEQWAFSPEYQEISKHRQAGSKGVVLLAKAIN